MSTYNEALLLARKGEIILRPSRAGVVRFLTEEEAEPAFRERRHVGDGRHATHPRRLGLFVVSHFGAEEFRPTEEDLAATDWTTEREEARRAAEHEASLLLGDPPETASEEPADVG